MNERLEYARGCVARIHHLWFDEHAEDDPIEKIGALFDTVSTLAPYECVYHVHGLWLAYRSSREEPRQCYIARYRFALFNAGLRRLYDITNKTFCAMSEDRR